LGVCDRPDVHQLLKLIEGAIGKEEDSFLEGVAQLFSLGEALDLMSVGGRGRVQLESTFTHKGSSKHPALNRDSKAEPAVLKRKSAGVALPDHVLGDRSLVARLK